MMTSFHLRVTSSQVVLVVGGAGFLGMHLSLSLAEDAGNDVTVLDRMGSPYPYNHPQVSKWIYDVRP